MPSLDLVAWTLILLWGALLFGGLLRSDPAQRQRMPRWTRLGSSAMLVLLGWYGASLAITAPAIHYALLTAAGMSLGFIGDLLRAQVLLVPRRILAALAVFGGGHLFYIAAVAGYAPSAWPSSLLWLLGGGILYASLFLRDIFRRDKGGRCSLRWAAFPYGLLLSAAAGIAIGLALRQPLFAGRAAGAFLFLLSDLILALALFDGRRFPYHSDLVWLLYGPGQMLIVTSIWSTFRPGALLP